METREKKSWNTEDRMKTEKLGIERMRKGLQSMVIRKKKKP